MSRILQLRRGNTAEHENFTGQIGEITMDTDAKNIRIHDGETPGGTPMARRDEIPDLTPFDYVTEWQMPTTDNNHTWYRKYKSGWVEQGGIIHSPDTTPVTQILPIEMNNDMYCLVYGVYFNSANTITSQIRNKTSESFGIKCSLQATNVAWYVCGISKS